MVGMDVVGDVWSQNMSVFQPSPAVLSATARNVFFSHQASTKTENFVCGMLGWLMWKTGHFS